MKTFKSNILLLILAFTALWGQMAAQPVSVHLNWSAGKASTASSITISWISADTISDGFVDYGVSAMKPLRVKARKTVAGGRAFHKLILEKLKPSTRYCYRCGNEQSGWSENYSFATAPLSGQRQQSKVIVWGDTQNNEFNERFEKTDQIVQQALLQNPNFSLHMGDMVNNGAITPDWLKFLAVAQPLNAVAPMMPTLGNHDIENHYPGSSFQQPFCSFSQLFSLPGNGMDYSFNYDNTHFVCIFSGFAQKAGEYGLLRYGKHSKESKWLKKDLARARKNPHIDWIIAYTHYPVYSFGASNVLLWKDNLAHILEKYQVDLCLSGHRHVYERHHAVESGLCSPNGKGTIYITNGTSGGSPQGLGGKEMPTMAFTSSEKMYNYALMTIHGKNLKYEVFDQNSAKIDELVLTK